ncbi:MAG TPA: PocR ligand-binding domain-containing protein [Candidatus Krumholzibacteria bacterium]|nr:PocR ligand-binding domain-containing protein [Candidatus Krumholzibacteria bacterium]
MAEQPPRTASPGPGDAFPVLPDSRLEIRDLPSAIGAQDVEADGGEALDLKAILDQQRIQEIMDDFHALTGMVTAILDLEGNILEATGWQDLCTQFHRVHPATSRNCTESDLALARALKPGQYADYHCANGLRDVVTPLYIRGRHVGNIFTGQFFYDDDEVDEAFFVRQAGQHGFDREAYLAALRRIPRYSRETIGHLMSFLVRMTEHISRIGLANLELAEESRIRQEAESGLNDSRARLRAVVHAMPDLVWMKDPDGVYLLCNERFERFFGAPESEILGKRDADFLPPDQVAFFRRHDLRAMERGGPTMNIEEVTFAADGHVETLETVKTPICDEQGRISGVLGIGRDITARLQAERALRDNEARLREAQRLESIGRLAAGISHDLNNLLTPILGYAELAAMQVEAGDPQADAFAQIIYASERARDLVGQLTAFARKQTLEYRIVDVNAAVGRLEKLLRRSLRANITLQLDLAADTPPVRVDLGQLEQVIMNLALNAADSMPDGGTVRIETAAARADAARDPAMGPGPCAMLAVHDTGTGMDEATLGRIFEPFYSTKGELGTGLGLATVHGIVKQHGGEILVDSAPGRGTTFRMYLPAHAGGAAVGEEPAAVGANARPGRVAPEADVAVILLAEDNAAVRGLAATVLERQGYRVLAAASGEAALQRLDASGVAPDLLLTDMVMPGMSGKDLYDRLLEKHADLPVLYVSGYADMVFTVPDDGPRRERFLRKPFKTDDLVHLVRELVGARPRVG